jgi:hypothetical protein
MLGATERDRLIATRPPGNNFEIGSSHFPRLGDFLKLCADPFARDVSPALAYRIIIITNPSQSSAKSPSADVCELINMPDTRPAACQKSVFQRAAIPQIMDGAAFRQARKMLTFTLFPE